MNGPEEGLRNTFTVARLDGTSEPGKMHYLCEYFVLDLRHDCHSRKAFRAYAESCRSDNPTLSRDLLRKSDEMLEVDTPNF